VHREIRTACGVCRRNGEEMRLRESAPEKQRLGRDEDGKVNPAVCVVIRPKRPDDRG
jgi:hypothetical protein